MKLKGKIAVVTGAGSGIGRATAELFAEEGAAVVVAEVTESAGQETVDSIRRAGGEAIFVKTDVSNAGQVESMVQMVMNTYGRIDILFNCAAIFLIASLTETTEEQWDRLMAVNLKGIFLCSKSILPRMIESGGGSIVNASSVVGLNGAFARQAAYCASKAAITMLTRAMTLDYAQYNIRVNCVCPGPTVTPLMAGGRSEAEIQKIAETFPMKRWAQPREIAKAVLFLASDDASFINGTALLVDGGQTAER